MLLESVYVSSFWLWPDDDPSLELKLVAIQIKLFTSELVVTVNIYTRVSQMKTLNL